MNAWKFRRADECPPGQHGRFVKAEYVGNASTAVVGGRTMLCVACKLPIEARVAPLTVSAATWHDARAVAMASFHTSDLTWETSDSDPDVTVEWVGRESKARRLVTWADEQAAVKKRKRVA